MRAIAGAFRRSRASCSSLKQGGYAALVYVFVVFGLVSVGILFAPNLLPKLLENKREIEEQRLTRVGRAFEESVQRTLMIPGQKNWSTQVMAFAGMDQTEVEQTDPAFAGDPNLTRVYLIDPGLSGSLLPYVESDNGLSRSQTNLVGPAARVMIVSNTKRGLILPISSGLAASTTAFENIWNWTYDPQTKAPPAVWPREWNGNGNFLHVLRLNLANSFQHVTGRNLR